MQLSKSKQNKIETFLKWEKQKVEKAVQQQLFTRATEITDALIARALQGDVNAINTSYDRMFGKTKQQVDIDTGGAPIIFMPAVLMDKFGLSSPSPQEKDKPVIIDMPATKPVSPVSKVRQHATNNKREKAGV